MAYKIDEIIAPFWAESGGISRGRDPLAIQNSSVATYVKLLPGLTNVTTRLRYYGFYLWVIEEFTKNKFIKNNDNYDEQIKFIRRSELILAFITRINFDKVNGISGSLYASQQIKIGDASSFYDIAYGADRGRTNTYWGLSTGAFGQYYIGVLKFLHLINEPTDFTDYNIYLNSSKGRKLAEEFDKNIPAKQKELFFQSVINGKLNKNEIPEFQNFSLAEIPYNTGEWKFYIEMVLNKDDISEYDAFNHTFRKQTVKLFLQYIKDSPEKSNREEFLNYLYNRRTIEDLENNKAFTGWYYYKVNELMHDAYETIFCSFLFKLEEQKFSVDLKWLISELKKDTFRFIKEEFAIKNPEAFLFKELITLLKKTETGTLQEQATEGYNEGNYGKSISYSLHLIIAVYEENKINLNRLYDFALKNNVERNGYIKQLVEELILLKKELTLDEYLDFILYKAINDHIYSSFQKFNIGQAEVQTFLMEDSHVRFLREINPSPTTPRIQILHSFLIDLKLIDGNKLTPIGSEILNQL
ncbi:MAG: hypothetical protein Q8L81_01610 [Bacteroidota bacterium]|nr:hypothetical protein [Bacteroidota bacterium]